jgi:hypothetical protein
MFKTHRRYQKMGLSSDGRRSNMESIVEQSCNSLIVVHRRTIRLDDGATGGDLATDLVAASKAFRQVIDESARWGKKRKQRARRDGQKDLCAFLTDFEQRITASA